MTDAATYRSARVRALLVSSVIIVWAASVALSWGALLYQDSILVRLYDGVYVSLEEAQRADTLVSIGAAFYLSAGIGSILAFCLWLYRTSANLRSLAIDHVKYSPRSSVVAFFIPVVNLVRPYSVMREVYALSAPSVHVTPLVPAWWALCLIWLFGTLVGPDPDLTRAGDMIPRYGLAIFADACGVAAGIILVVLIIRITLWHETLRASSATWPSPRQQQDATIVQR